MVAVGLLPAAVVDPSRAAVAHMHKPRRVEAVHDLDAGTLQHVDGARARASAVAAVWAARPLCRR